MLLLSKLAERHVRPRWLRREVRHVAGPEEIEYGPEEVLAICVVRDGALHVESFLQHHFSLGVRHVVLLDNGSTDGTAEIARRHDNVTVLASGLPYQRYENVMKRYLARRFSRGRWNLCVDIDERFDYPFSGDLPLSRLIAYLDRHAYTAVVAQMLDMLPEGRLSEAEAFPFYDIAAVRKSEYPFGEVSNPAVKMHRGGIREAAFGTDNGLTKAALVRVEDSIDLFVKYHHAANARIADFTCVLLHYPFAGPFAAKVAEAVATGRYGSLTTREYERYQKSLERDSDPVLRRPTARRLERVEQLVDEGFLVVSEPYRRWVESGG
jgi:glycosyltransferase involved in cell wall biosynthesis